ncbi:hypothetical protein KQX54_005706 [Cotesia glomerata]|uniref:Uncharacterized protein n=1 Tax=Cotesia glomerata TaxID=32391 RepID=A0AAV7IF79_COTGL|nr:hypothetical protein KQX54_005706 [Cotesia glomerata]
MKLGIRRFQKRFNGKETITRGEPPLYLKENHQNEERTKGILISRSISELASNFQQSAPLRNQELHKYHQSQSNFNWLRYTLDFEANETVSPELRSAKCCF